MLRGKLHRPHTATQQKAGDAGVGDGKMGGS